MSDINSNQRYMLGVFYIFILKLGFFNNINKHLGFYIKSMQVVIKHTMT